MRCYSSRAAAHIKYVLPDFSACRSKYQISFLKKKGLTTSLRYPLLNNLFTNLITKT